MPPSPTAFRTTRKPGEACPRAPADAAAGSMSTATVAQLSRMRRIGATRVLRTNAGRNVRDMGEARVSMPDDHLQQRADILAARVEALAEALRAGGVPDEAAAQLLS